VLFKYKNNEETHQFTSNRILDLELIERNIENFVRRKYGPGCDVSKIDIKSYNYHEND